MATGKPIALVAATAKVVADNPTSDNFQAVVVENTTGAAVFFGGPDVTNTNYGFQVATGATYAFQLAPEDSVYAYSVAGSASGLKVFTSP